MVQITKFTLLAASALSLFSSPVHAADINPYVNLGVGLIDAENRTDFNGVFSGLIRGGVEISSNFALEGEGQIGLGEKKRDQIFSDIRFDENAVRLNHQYGVYAVGRIPISEAVSLQARAGYAAYQSTNTVDQFFEGTAVVTSTTTLNFSGLSLGIGGQYMFGEERLNGIRLDSFGVFDVDDSDGGEGGLPSIDAPIGYSISYVRKF